MPLADAGGMIAVVFKEGRHGEAARLDEPRTHAAEHAALQPRTPVVAAGQNPVARGRTDR